MSAQDTSFEALAASPGDFAVDSEWMGDSPPALTVDFIQNSHKHVHHIHQIDRLQKQQGHAFHTFDSTAAGGPGVGNTGISKGQLLEDDPALNLSSQPPTVSSPESLLSSFQDSSSDISSSKQTSMSALSSHISGTPAKKGRGRPKGPERSNTTEAFKRSVTGVSRQPSQLKEQATDYSEHDMMMTDDTLIGVDGDGDGAQQNWSFRDYLRLDDDQENGDNGHDQSNYETAKDESDILGTIDPKSIQHTPSFGGDDEQLGEEAAALRASNKDSVDLSPYSAGLSPLDFVSATSSPIPDDPAIPTFSTTQLFSASATAFNATPLQTSLAQQPRKGHSKAASQYSLNQSMNNLNTAASRDVSPASNFVFGQGPSPQNYMQASQSPIDTNDFRFGFMSGGGPDHMQMAPNFLLSKSNPTSPNSTWQGNSLQQQHQQQMLNDMTSQMPFFHHGLPTTVPLMNAQQHAPQLTVGIDPHKSRVETQIPVTILLSSLPPGVTKLHLPPHAISKPKLLSKSPVEHSPDMLELHAMVVCTSAMLNEGNRRRALERAGAATHAPQAAPTGKPSGEDEDDGRPANGGEIWICEGCMQRERKRANRKKSKKPEDDEEWSREEHRRIIIFNTNEVRDWQASTPSSAMSQGGSASIVVPMRITCYCRHHGEKTGFQVIFTIKDFRGQVLAQTVSRSIMITDDHKTPTAPSAGSASAAASIADGEASAGDAQSAAKISANTTPTSAAKAVAANLGKAKSPSSSQPGADFSALKRNSVTFSALQPSEKTNNVNAAGAVTAAAAARALSRPASPDGLKGHSAKKRKSNAGATKMPAGLAMTRIETSPQQSTQQSLPSAGHRLSTSSSPVARFSNNPSFLSPTGFVPDSMAAAVDMALMAGGSGDPDIDSLAGMVPMNADPLAGGPLTPNSHTDQGGAFTNGNNGNRSGSFDNLALSQTPMFSAPTSAHPSRAPSPNGIRNSMHMFQQQLFHQQQQQLQQQQLQQQLNQVQFSQPFPANLFNLPMAMPQSATSPTSQPVIHKVIPSEGPKSGGIEVTILGSAFYQGLDVMFGDQRATTTTFWGESSLVCLVPPSPIAGHVPVTLRQSNQRTAQPFASTQQRITFKYLDDDEQQLLRAALTVLSRKMTGKIEDAQDVARRIIGSETSNWGTGGGNSGGSSAGSTRGVAGNSASLTSDGRNPNFEGHLLKVLELIDLDDSSNHTRLNMQRRTTGHSMLHLACVLGMHRFVAGLLARGANPDVRDNGGYTPLHLAALNNQPEIVRRLIHAGADPTMRTLSGLTASEVAASREVLRAIKRFERHARSRSGGSLHSRTSSAASLRSLWEPMTMSAMHHHASGAGIETENTVDSESSSRAEVDSSFYAASGDDNDVSSEQEGDEEWLDMRPGARVVSRSSLSIHSRRGVRDTSPNSATVAAAPRGVNIPAAPASPAAAAVTAFKEQLSAHFQQFVTQIPQIPNNPLPDYYQAYLNSAAFQRISSLVPNISGAIGSRPNSSGDNSNPKNLETRWWDLSSLMTTSAVPPPAYEEIFPPKGEDMDTKQATAAVAAAEAEADGKCAALYDNQQHVEMSKEVGSNSATATAVQVEENAKDVAAAEEGEQTVSTPVLQIGRKHQITKEQQENFRRVHQEKRKGLSSDTFLYTVWIPILLGVLLLWLSGARAWDFFPSVTFNVPYTTSLGNPTRPTGTGANNKNNGNNNAGGKQILPPPPAVATVPNDAAGHDGIIASLEGIEV